MAYKIVSVEDDSQIAELLQFVLQHKDLNVHFAHDGVSGLSLIRSVRPHLILLDVMLPELDGWQVYDAIRADETLCRLPVIMVSVVADLRERRAIFGSSRIDSYFTKPFDTRRLRIEVERMLGITLWDMPPMRSTSEVVCAPVDPAAATRSQPHSAAEPPADLDDTQPALPLRPMRSSRPARRVDSPADTTEADSAAQHGEAPADT